MEEINLIEVFQYFKSKLLWIIITIVAAVVIGNTYTVLTRVPMYKSNTTLVLVNNKSDSYSQNDLNVNQKLVSTYTEIVKSRKVLGQVIENLDLKYTVSDLSKNISVSSVSDTEIIKIEVNDKSAKEAKKIADEIAEVFAKEIKDFYNLENVSVLDKALKAEGPYNMTYAKDNLIYLVFGLVLSCGVIFVIYYFDTTIKSTEVIEEKLGLTVLGVVPVEGKGK